MDYSKLTTSYISDSRRSLEFIMLATGVEEFDYINERLNALCIAFARILSKEKANEFKEFLTSFIFPNDLVRFKFKELTSPINEKRIMDAEEFLKWYIKYNVND